MSSLQVSLGAIQGVETHVLHSDGWLSPFSNSPDGRYDYHAINSWIVAATDPNYSLLFRIWYIDIEIHAGCSNDALMVRKRCHIYITVLPRVSSGSVILQALTCRNPRCHIIGTLNRPTCFREEEF